MWSDTGSNLAFVSLCTGQVGSVIHRSYPKAEPRWCSLGKAWQELHRQQVRCLSLSQKQTLKGPPLTGSSLALQSHHSFDSVSVSISVLLSSLLFSSKQICLRFHTFSLLPKTPIWKSLSQPVSSSLL